MQKDMMDNFQKMTQMAMDNFKKLSEINNRVAEKLTQEATDLTTAVFDNTAESVEDIVETKNPNDIPSMQAKATQELGKLVMNSARSSADILADAGKVYANMFESGMKEASNTVGKTGSKSRKSA